MMTSTETCMNSRLYVLSALTVMIAACAEPPVTPQVSLSGGRRTASIDGAKSYVILATGNSLPSGFSASIGAAGGQVVYSMDNIGVALVASSDPDFAVKAAGIKDVLGVTPDARLNFSLPANPQTANATQPSLSSFSGVGSGEPYRAYQWPVDAIHAPGAWATGAQGQSVRVAIIDGGIYDAHPDLAANFDAAHSRSFVPGQPYNYDQ